LSLAERYRPHSQHHERTLEQQILDALLRIEELLIAQQELLQKPEEPAAEAPKKLASTKLEAKPTRKVDRL
jgi:hypothetical protein